MVFCCYFLSSLPSPATSVAQKLSRFASQHPHFRRESSVTHSLAAQYKKAVSLDLSDGVLSDGLIEGIADDPFQESQLSRTAKVTQTRVRVESSDDFSSIASSSETRIRTNSDLTPGGVIDNTVPKLLEHCRVDEHKAFMPFFPPGRILHLQVKKSDR